mmetsp:Transcript_35125/g.80416  ORF Transcript_35125/g.80416 Transcript_35125/m.80416 type:complete len:249 (-) Transcript_35125:653-1399(-)
MSCRAGFSCSGFFRMGTWPCMSALKPYFSLPIFCARDLALADENFSSSSCFVLSRKKHSSSFSTLRTASSVMLYLSAKRFTSTLFSASPQVRSTPLTVPSTLGVGGARMYAETGVCIPELARGVPGAAPLENGPCPTFGVPGAGVAAGGTLGVPGTCLGVAGKLLGVLGICLGVTGPMGVVGIGICGVGGEALHRLAPGPGNLGSDASFVSLFSGFALSRSSCLKDVVGSLTPRYFSTSDLWKNLLTL